jgi:hypothetical protein
MDKMTDHQKNQCDTLLGFLHETRRLPSTNQSIESWLQAMELRRWRYVSIKQFIRAVNLHMPHLTQPEREYLILNADIGAKL